MKKPLLAAMSLTLVTFMVQATANSVSDTSAATEHATPDNSEVNKRDRDGRTVTPMDQSNTQKDLDITQAIRTSLMQHELSTYAKNIKIITQDGEVTLRGPVSSRAEVKQIAELTKAVPGIKALNNQLEVK